MKWKKKKNLNYNFDNKKFISLKKKKEKFDLSQLKIIQKSLK